MAVAAFKSTTKRVLGIGGGNESENASIVPLQPSTPSNKGNHRRSRSVSDFSSRYFTDSSSVAADANSRHLDSLFRQGRSTSLHHSDDSESEAESTYSRHTCRSRQNAKIGASRKAALLSGKSKGTKSEVQKSTSELGGNHREILDFLSCIGDQSDTESVFSRPTFRSRRFEDLQSDTESVLIRLSAPRSRRFDHQSDSESVFTRLSSRGRRGDDRQSDSESVFSRLARPRQSGDLCPPGARDQQSGRTKGTRAGVLRRSTSQINLSGPPFQSHDDQSETESSYNYGGRQSLDFGASRIAAPARKKGTRQAAFRKSVSQTEISDSSVVSGFRQSTRQQDDTDSPEEAFYAREVDHQPGVKEASSDHPEEEKTIRAVHTQNKESRAQELDAISLYDAMRVEMRQAVLDIRSEIEQKSVTKDLVRATQTLPGSLHGNVPGESDDNESAVAMVRKEYAAKLEQSEKRAHDLWTQLAAEEQRCLDLVKFVKELLPSQAGSCPKPQPPPSIRPMMGPEVEKQLVSQCLDADAQRYFDECVSISGLDVMSVNDASSCGAGYQESESAWSVKDLALSPRKKDLGRTHEKKMALLEPLISFCAQIEQTGRCMGQSSNLRARMTVNEDGLFLPWLKWETDSDFSIQEQLGKDKDKAGNCSLRANKSSRSWSMTKSKSAISPHSDHSNKLQESQPFELPPGVSGLGCLSNGDLSIFKRIDFGELKNVGGSSTHDRERYSGHIDVEMFVLQRMWLRHRIRDGRILVCGGIRV